MALYMQTQSEMVEELADRTGWSKSDVKRVLVELDEIVKLNLKDCIRTKIGGVVIEPKRRKGRNPATGEEIMIKAKPASVRVVVRVTKAVRDQAPSVRKLQNSL